MVTTSSGALMGETAKPTRAEILQRAREAKALKAKQEQTAPAVKAEKQNFTQDEKSVWVKAYGMAIISAQVNHPSRLTMAYAIADQALADFQTKFGG